MVNERGIVRIVEASIAIVIIISVIVVFTVLRIGDRNDENLAGKIPPLLEEISKDRGLRDKILVGPDLAAVEDELKVFVMDRLPRDLNVEVKVCGVDDPCLLDSGITDIIENLYSGERIISASIDNDFERDEVKKVKIFLWRR